MIKVIGLTGPIGAGKDEVARLLRRRGAFVIDADKLAHILYSTQSPVWRELVHAFGSKILNRGGVVNRKKLGQIVFSDEKKLRQLNRIIHPYLKDVIIQVIEARKTEGKELIVVNAAVLKEIGLMNYVDQVWLVMAPRRKRLKRLLRAGLSKKEAASRIRSQMGQKEYLKLADVVIDNGGTLRGLARKVVDLL